MTQACVVPSHANVTAIVETEQRAQMNTFYIRQK